MEEKTMTYLCRFDENGRRGETRLACEYTDEQKAEMIADGFVEISEADWELYCEGGGNKYIRGTDGKPILAPPHVPTKAEKLAQLDNQYDINKAEMRKNMTNALLLGDDSLMADLRAEMTAIDTAYEEERQAIIDG